MSDLVGNPEDRFSHDVADFIISGASNLKELQQKLSHMLMIRQHKSDLAKNKSNTCIVV